LTAMTISHATANFLSAFIWRTSVMARENLPAATEGRATAFF
jgi:hypothetical protein